VDTLVLGRLLEDRGAVGDPEEDVGARVDEEARPR
jgi:hypothetical protein